MAPSDLTLEESFRRALRSAAKDESGFMIETLLSAVDGNALLERVATEELAPRAAHLELHLTGEEVAEHATNAKSFGTFLVRISEAGKEYVKDRLRIPSFSSDIQVAPGPGSVRATFFAPDPVDVTQNPFADSTASEALWTDANLQSDALHHIAVVLSNSDPDSPESEALDGAIQQLPMASRKHLRSAVNEAVRRDWVIEGEFRQRGIGVEPVKMSVSAARYLSKRLVVEEVVRETWTTTGILDGHKWSTGLMYFIPSDRGRPFPASYASMEVQQRVAELDTVPEQKVEATFTVFIQHGQGNSDSGTRSYVLNEVRPLDSGPGVELDIAAY
jgi:hypothetical protein